MNCKCGGHTTDKKVIRNKVTAGEYAHCGFCGRIMWLSISDELKEELKGERETAKTISASIA